LLNAYLVSGDEVFFDCRVTAAANKDGYKFCRYSAGSGCPYIGLPAYPRFTMRPVKIPETVEGCKKLCRVYESFDGSPVSYLQYESERCVADLTCEQHTTGQNPSQMRSRING